MTDVWTDRLSEYLDAELSGSERAALEEHLESCADCARTLEELRRVTTRAGALQDRPPAESLWPGIAARIAAKGAAPRRGVRRRLSFTVPQLAAAAAVLILLTAGGMWLALSSRMDRAAALAARSQTSGVGITAVAASTYDAAVAEMQRLLDERRDQLDSATIRVLEENLAAIDQAIAEARAALAEDPSNAYLNKHLATTMWRKVHLLRRAATLTGEAT